MAEVEHDDLHEDDPTVAHATQAALDTALATIDALKTGAFEVVFDGAGSALTTGDKLDFEVPFACTLTGWTMEGREASGSIVIDIWKDAYANLPPVVGDSICSASKPTISAAHKNQDLAISDWSGEVLALGDWLRFNIDSITTFTRVTLSLRYTRT